ncbi:MAG: hypothetical protein HKP48_01970 [Winogradskyella sp.]|uniref:hypothetical protein n=1 Tax=Winogradskyella sp. TaxID=1883156 RepID=UPI0018148507|nr:hypothetical protein [Winogradskyella sp.]MBT8243721.1 hypothetical protein [Winogradskyella sp.]NNK22085.1 hypothetical protein [Winogradskyella sp.]
MKILKQTRKLIAIFLMVTFLMPSIYSCSDNNVNYLETNQYEKESEGIINAINNYNNSQNSQAFRANSNSVITQQLVDEYLVLLGFSSGELLASDVDNIVTTQLQGRTYNELMQDYNLSSFARLSLNEIKDGAFLDDLVNNPDFQNLSDNEKLIVSLSNSFMDAHRGSGHTIEEATGALIGIIIGAACCGFLGAIGGAIIGALIGGGSK